MCVLAILVAISAGDALRPRRWEQVLLAATALVQICCLTSMSPLALPDFDDSAIFSLTLPPARFWLKAASLFDSTESVPKALRAVIGGCLLHSWTVTHVAVVC